MLSRARQWPATSPRARRCASSSLESYARLAGAARSTLRTRRTRLASGLRVRIHLHMARTACGLLTQGDLLTQAVGRNSLRPGITSD